MPFLREKEDAVMDLLMQVFQAGQPKPDAIPLAFIDIDDRTDRLWGESLQVPRDKLLSLIQFAVAAKPKLVFVDVELSKASCPADADQKLFEFIKSYVDPSDPPLILPQGIRLALDENESASLRPSFLDPALENSNSRVLQASALFDIDDNDGILRRWRLFERIGKGPTSIQPSVQLLAFALTHAPETSPKLNLIKLRTQLNALDNQDSIDVAGLNLAITQSRLSQRIVYSTPREIPAWRSQPEVPRADGIMVPYLEVLSASCVTDSDRNVGCVRAYPTGRIEKTQENWLKDRIVVIGASNTSARDFVGTPIGVLPGSMVVLNAMSTLDQDGILSRPPFLIGMFLETLIVIMGYLLHAWIAPKSSDFLFMAGVSLLFMPLCYTFYKYGIWLTLALPLFLSSVADMTAFARKIMRFWLSARLKNGQKSV